jgi:hypothetical protein
MRWQSVKIFFTCTEMSAHDYHALNVNAVVDTPTGTNEELCIQRNTVVVHTLAPLPFNKSPACFIQYKSL